ncbi:MAG: cation transporter [Erysipelotrichaceae bacterium]|nr:cation transporter [Erysipelotrichaceae bacterium]
MTYTMKIEGMMCKHCVKHVKDALENLGVSAEVSLENKCAVVNGEADVDALVKAVTEAGYEVVEVA